jgi:hypothetical protein
MDIQEKKDAIKKLEDSLVNYKQFIESNEEIKFAYNLIGSISNKLKANDYYGIIGDVAEIMGYYARIEFISNTKNAEANISYISKKRYQAGTFLRIKQEYQKITNEAALKKTDQELYEIMLYENEKRLEADNYKSLCYIIKTFISTSQSILSFVKAGQYHNENN